MNSQATNDFYYFFVNMLTVLITQISQKDDITKTKSPKTSILFLYSKMQAVPEDNACIKVQAEP